MYELTIFTAAIALMGAIGLALNKDVHEGPVVDFGILLASIGSLGLVLRGLSQRDSYLADQFTTALVYIGLDLVILGLFLKLKPKEDDKKGGGSGEESDAKPRRGGGSGEE